jgi:hypothetical protein
MGLFDFFWKMKVTNKSVTPTGDNEDRSQWTGKDFEFLITGDVDIPAAEYDQIMTPNTFQWEKVNRGDWYYYQVGEDEFNYSWEMPGIQMTFNKEIKFEKAKRIAEEVISNIKASGQEAQLVVLNRSTVYRFD